MNINVAINFFSEWQDEPTVVLIEFIKTHKSIWDSSDVMYRNVRMNKNLFLDLVQHLSAKYPEHGYTYGNFNFTLHLYNSTINTNCFFRNCKT